MPSVAFNLNRLTSEQITQAISSCSAQEIELRGTDRNIGVNAGDFAQLEKSKLAAAVAAIASLPQTPQITLNLEELSSSLVTDFVDLLKLHKISPDNLAVEINTFGEPTFNSDAARVAQKLPVSKQFVEQVPAKTLLVEVSGSRASEFCDSLPKNTFLKNLTLSPVMFNKPGFRKLTQALKDSRIEVFTRGPSTRNTRTLTLASFEPEVPPVMRQNKLLNGLRKNLSTQHEQQTDAQLLQSRVAKKVVQGLLQASQHGQTIGEDSIGRINQFLTVRDAFNVSRSNQSSYQAATSLDNYSHEQIDALRAAYSSRRREAADQAAPTDEAAQRGQKRPRQG